MPMETRMMKTKLAVVLMNGAKRKIITAACTRPIATGFSQISRTMPLIPTCMILLSTVTKKRITTTRLDKFAKAAPGSPSQGINNKHRQIFMAAESIANLAFVPGIPMPKRMYEGIAVSDVNMAETDKIARTELLFIPYCRPIQLLMIWLDSTMTGVAIETTIKTEYLLAFR